MARILLELEGQDKGAKAAVDKLRQELAELDRATDSVDFKQLTEEIARAGGDFRSVSGEIDGYIGRLRAATPENAKTAASFAAVVQAFERGEISADQAADELERLQRELKQTGDSAQGAKGGIGSFAGSLTELKSGVDLALGAVRTFVEAGKQVYAFGRAGAELDYAGVKFERLAERIDTTSDALLGKLREATKGTLSDAQLMAGAGDLMSLGLAKSEDQVVRLSKVIGGLGMDMNQLVLTMSNQTTMRFDQLGVSVDGFQKKVDALTATGMNANDAFNEAFLRQAEEQLEKVGNKADENIGSFQRFEAALGNFTDKVKNDAAPAVADFADAMADLLNQAMQNDAYRAATKGMTDIERGAYLAAQAQNRLTVAGYNARVEYEKNRVAAEKNAAATEEVGDASVKTVSSIDRYKRAIAEAAEGADNATKRAEAHAAALMGFYDDLRTATSGGGFGDMTEDFEATQADIRAQIEETTAKLGELETKQPWKVDEIQGYKDKLAELDDKLAETADAHAEAMHRMAYDMIAQRAAADGMTENELANLTTLAQSWGLYDETTAAVIQAINKNLGSLDTSGPEAMQSAIAGILNLPDSKTITVETKMEGGTEVADGASPEEIEARFMSAAQTGAAAMGELGGAAAEAQTAIGDTSGIDQFAAAVDQAPAAAETFKTGVNVIVEETLPVFNESIMEAWELVDKLVSRLEDFARTWEATVRVRGEGEIPGGTPIDNSYGDLEEEEEDFNNAAGGRIGSPSWVGENGPEIFAPDTPGYVLNRGDAMNAVRESVRSDIWRAAVGASGGGGSPVSQSSETYMSFGQVILPNVTNTREFMAELYRLARRGAAAGVGYAGG